MDDRNRSPQRPQEMEGALLVDDDETLDEGESNAPRGHAGDGKAERAAETLQELLRRMDLEAHVRVREDGERVVLDVDGPDVGRAIGKKGQTLDALQFLVNKIANRFPVGRRHVIVDSGDYRERHDESLVSLAQREAKKAVQWGKVVTLEPMPPRDRRVIHLSLAKFDGVTTRSDGRGAERRIQIIPAREGRGGGGGGGGGGDRDGRSDRVRRARDD